MGLSGFPVLNLRGGDVTRGWREFEDEFELTVQLRELEMGARMEEGTIERAVPNFGERAKLLILLRGWKIYIVFQRVKYFYTRSYL